MRGGRPFGTLARLTLLEVSRRPVALLLLLTAVGLSLLSPVLNLFRFGEDGKLARDGAFALHAGLGMLLAGYAAATTLAAERRRGTLEAALGAPVGRGAFFLARYAGIATALGVFSLCCTVATLLAERIAERFVSGPTGIAWSMDTATATRSLVLVTAALVVAAWLNYRRQRPFESAAAWLIPVALLAALALSGLFDRDGVWAPFDPGVNWRLAPVSLLITLALMVLAALALTVSTFAPPAPTVAITVAVFAAGLAVDYYLGQPHPGHARWLALAPNWQHFWLADAINNGGGIAGTYVARAAAYALLQTLGWLALGVAAFRHAEVGRRE